MKKLCYFVVVVFVLPAVMACNPREDSGSSDVRGSSRAGGSSLDSEGRKVALEHFEPLIVQCGDSYVYLREFMGRTLYSRHKRANFVIEEYTTEADKLNGITWRGKAGYEFNGPVQDYEKTNDAWKIKNENNANKWEAWRDVNPSEITFTFTKKNGQWVIGENTADLRPLKCSEIPN